MIPRLVVVAGVALGLLAGWIAAVAGVFAADLVGLAVATMTIAAFHPRSN